MSKADESDEAGEATRGAPPIAWDIRREARAWTGAEFLVRAERLPQVSLEISDGKLFFREETRRTILAMLLENVGLDAAVRLGDLAQWKEAIAAAERDHTPKPPGGR
jgi:hypothetical protein